MHTSLTSTHRRDDDLLHGFREMAEEEPVRDAEDAPAEAGDHDTESELAVPLGIMENATRVRAVMHLDDGR